MEEFKQVMGKDNGNNYENAFGDIQPMEALDYIFTVSMTTGLESLPENTRTKRTIQTIAKMPESDLRIWASQMASSPETKAEIGKIGSVDYYLGRARSLQNFCAGNLGGEGKKEAVH